MTLRKLEVEEERSKVRELVELDARVEEVLCSRKRDSLSPGKAASAVNANKSMCKQGLSSSLGLN